MTSDSTDKRTRMSLPEFAALLRSHGASARRWPEAVRSRAATLLAASAEARAMQADEAALDRLLDASEAPPPPTALREAILAAAPRPGSRRRAGGFWPELRSALGGWRPATAALAASLLLGVASGGVLSGAPADDIGADLAQLAMFEDNFTGY